MRHAGRQAVLPRPSPHRSVCQEGSCFHPEKQNSRPRIPDRLPASAAISWKQPSAGTRTPSRRVPTLKTLTFIPWCPGALRTRMYSIIETCFLMPCGVECDQYSVIGEITAVARTKQDYRRGDLLQPDPGLQRHGFPRDNQQQDLLGEPKTGRRFKGQVWIRGTVKFEA